jgi:predicted SprT family Zn-dependent metalloprotease
MTSLFQAVVLPTLLLTLVSASGCSKSSNDLGQAPRQLSDDFFVTVAKVGKSPPGGAEFSTPESQGPIDERSNCEAALAKAVCETSANTQEITTRYKSVLCSQDSAKYVPALMEIYEEMPERMRLSLCTLDRVFISDGIASTAFASTVTDGFGTVTGGYVGMRKGTVISQPTSAQIVSWKEQLAFGGSTRFLANDPKLVQINYNLKMSFLKSDGLFYVLMHELGHLIDFNNNIDSQEGRETDWNRLSWQSSDSPLAEATFFKRDDFCFYNCSSYLNPRDANEIYNSLSKSSFVTSYSATNPYEDFAEFWAWHMMEKYKNPDYKITIPGEGTIDMNEIFKSNPKIKAKIEFIDQLWNRADLKIDNRAGKI